RHQRARRTLTPAPSSLTMQSLLNRRPPLRALATRQRCAQLLALTLSLTLAGCGGGKPAGSPVAAPPVPGSESTLKQQLDDLERRGELPALDRSSDIAGPDADHNGIRDDIDAYITALPVNDAVKKAAR